MRNLLMYPLQADELLKAFETARALSDDYHRDLIGSISPLALTKLSKFLQENKEQLETYLSEDREP